MAAAAIARPRVTRVKPRLRVAPPPRIIIPVQQLDNSRVKRVADPREIRTVMMCLVVGVLVFAGLLVLAWEQFAIVKDGYDIADLKAKRESLVEDNKTLASQAATLRNPARITDYATASLGMTQPKSGQVVHFDSPMAPVEGEPVMAHLHPYTGKP